MPRERPPFSALNFRSGAYHFHKWPKNPVRSITVLLFFCRSGDHHVQNFFNFNPFTASHGRLSPRPGLAVGQSSSQTRPSRSSGDPHFHAQNGSSSVGSPAVSRSKWLKLVPEPRIFTVSTVALVSEPGPIFHFAADHSPYQWWVERGRNRCARP